MKERMVWQRSHTIMHLPRMTNQSQPISTTKSYCRAGLISSLDSISVNTFVRLPVCIRIGCKPQDVVPGYKFRKSSRAEKSSENILDRTWNRPITLNLNVHSWASYSSSWTSVAQCSPILRSMPNISGSTHTPSYIYFAFHYVQTCPKRSKQQFMKKWTVNCHS